MAQAQIYEGTPTQLAEQLLKLPQFQKYRMTLVLEEPLEEGAESLEAAIARMITCQVRSDANMRRGSTRH